MNEPRAAPITALFVSPHFDDIALSCGGTAAIEARAGRALVVTVFAGAPTGPLNSFAEFQHQRWGAQDDAVAARRREDDAAMAALGADSTRLDYHDAIYRGDLYLSDDDLFGPVKAADQSVADAVAQSVTAIVQQASPRRVYLPLSVGNHVDHQICTALAARLVAERLTVLLYEDFPYAATPGAVERRVERLDRTLKPTIVDISETIERRLAAIRCYASQVPTIFRHHGRAEDVVRQYASSVGNGDYAERFWKL